MINKELKESLMKILLTTIFILSLSMAYAQDLADYEALLKGKNVTEQELQKKLESKGIDVENIKPEDLPGLENTINEAIREIQEEKGITANPGTVVTEEQSGAPTLEKNENSSGNKTLLEEYTELKDEESVIAVYGHSIFKDKTLDFYETNQSKTPPSSYVLDAGDKVAISIFGKSQADLIYEIEEDGFIRPTGMYKIYLKGLSFGNAKKMLFQRFKQAYSFGKGQFNVDITSARNISVNVYGEVRNPGTYTISAFNSALSAIIAAGGPTIKGSVRNIQLITDGKEKNIDVYDFLTNPDASDKYGLLNNAIIFVPPFENRISLQGPFDKTGYFEMKAGETVRDLIYFAGGVRKNVSVENYNIVRTEDNQQNLYTYDYNTSSGLKLEDFDQVIFRYINKSYENFVEVEGAVQFEGIYALQENFTIEDVLKLAGIERFTRTDLAYLTRRNENGTYRLLPINLELELSEANNSKMELLPQDKIIILNKENYADSYTFSLMGGVRKQLTNYTWDTKGELTIADAVELADGLKPNATEFAYVIRNNPDNRKKFDYKLINIKEAVADRNSGSNIKILKGDSIVIPTVGDFSDQFIVKVGGSVRKAGGFPYSESLTLKEVITMAGGLKDEAEASRVDIFRLELNSDGAQISKTLSVKVDKEMNPLSSNDRVELYPGDVIEVRKIPNYGQIKTVKIDGGVVYPGNYAITLENERISDLIEKAGGLTKQANISGGQIARKVDGVGFVITNFSKLKINNKNNMIIKEGDVITIPDFHDIVQIKVSGTNASKSYNNDIISGGNISVPYHGTMRAGRYVRKYAGGFASNAKRGKTLVQHKSGRMVQARNYGLFRIYPKVTSNSEIIVTLKEEKKEEEPKEKKERDIYSDVRDFLALATSAVTIIVLSNNL